jgi:hypothetical protein
MSHMPRLVSATLLVAVILAFGVSPAAHAAKPTRTVIPAQGFEDPPGLSCPFGVAGQPDVRAHHVITEFSDGRVLDFGYGNPTLTNLETGASISQKLRFTSRQVYDADANDLRAEISGRFWVFLLEGDQGPFGVVGESNAFLLHVGRVGLTFDFDTGLVTSFSWAGTITDVCSLLSD